MSVGVMIEGTGAGGVRYKIIFTVPYMLQGV